MGRNLDAGAGLRGALAGAAATGVMSVAMLAAQRLGAIGRLPPHEITTEVLRRAEAADEMPPRRRRWLGWLVHFGFGATAGAVFGLLRSRLHPPGPGPLQGAAYAMVVWLLSYQGWVPALGFLPPATRDRPARQVTMVVAHLVFGVVLGSVATSTGREATRRR
jgi:uncharacterized membrane protein YagU involved in acid resistance